jgi:hypothetical protein
MDTFQVPSVDIRCSSELSSRLEATQEQILLERRRLGKPFLTAGSPAAAVWGFASACRL